jgi:hypothetical protein
MMQGIDEHIATLYKKIGTTESSLVSRSYSQNHVAVLHLIVSLARRIPI